MRSEDRYRVTAYDNRGMGRSPLPDDPLSVAALADDGAAVLARERLPDAHVATRRLLWPQGSRRTAIGRAPPPRDTE